MQSPLLALLLSILTAKLQVLASDAEAPRLGPDARAAIANGIQHLRDRIAEAGNGDRLRMAQSIAGGLARARHQLQNGSSSTGVLQYFPIDEQPAHLMKGKLGLAATGQREAATAVGLIGLQDQAAAWTASVDDPGDPRSGALRLISPSATARVLLAANDDNITSLMNCGAFDEDDEDVVLICSRRVVERQQRSPRTSLRDGKVGPRYISFGPMLSEAVSLEDLLHEFSNEVAI
jgi:hypothetical protein